MNFYLHPAAEEEHLETIIFYESKQPGLGAIYQAEFERVMKNVLKTPQSFPVVIEPDIQRIIMDKFPFSIFFRKKNKSIHILAIAHHKRRPVYWLGRL